MNIVVAAVGRPADVYPLFAVAGELQNRGHSVIVCMPEKYRSKVMQIGFRILTIGASFEEYLNGEADAPSLAREVPVQFVSLRDALREAHVLVGGMFLFSGPSMAEQFNVRYFYTITSPLLLNETGYRNFGVPLRRKTGLLTGLLQGKRGEGWDTDVRSAVNDERKYSGMPPVENIFRHLFRSGHILYALDAQAFSIPPGPNQTTTGFLHFDETTELSAAIQTLLQAAERPVLYVPGTHGAEKTQELCYNLARRNIRALVAQSESRQELLPDNCVRCDVWEAIRALPQTRAVIHSGDSMASIAAARAGVPQLAIPSLHEELQWAEAMHRLGVSVEPPEVTNELDDAIERLLNDQQPAAVAQAVAERLRSENSAAIAADTIES